MNSDVRDNIRKAIIEIFGNWLEPKEEEVLMFNSEYPFYMEQLIDLIQAREAAARIEGLKMAKEKDWKPGYVAQSEEEWGYQKGIMAQIALTNKNIDERIAELQSAEKGESHV